LWYFFKKKSALVCRNRLLLAAVEYFIGLLKKASINTMSSQDFLEFLCQANVRVTSDMRREEAARKTITPPEKEPWDVIIPETICIDDGPSPPTSPSMKVATPNQLGVSP
jgi:hypothetical protein